MYYVLFEGENINYFNYLHKLNDSNLNLNFVIWLIVFQHEFW